MSNKPEEALTLLKQELNIEQEWKKQKTRLGINFPHQLMGNDYQEWLNQFTQDEAEQATAQLDSLRSGLYSVLPMVCPGEDRCPHSHVCPFVRMKKVPIGLQCPIEQSIVVDRMQGLMAEYQIDGNKPSEFILLNRLVELELADFRSSSMLSSPEHQGIMKQVTTGSTPQGELIYNDIISPLMDIKERISREKMKLLSTLVGTPQERYKKQAALKQSSEAQYSNKIANINRKLNDIEKKLLEE